MSIPFQLRSACHFPQFLGPQENASSKVLSSLLPSMHRALSKPKQNPVPRQSDHPRGTNSQLPFLSPWQRSSLKNIYFFTIMSQNKSYPHTQTQAQLSLGGFAQTPLSCGDHFTHLWYPRCCGLLSQAPLYVATLFSPSSISMHNTILKHLSSTIICILDTIFKMTMNTLIKFSFTSWITFFGERVMNSCNS